VLGLPVPARTEFKDMAGLVAHAIGAAIKSSQRWSTTISAPFLPKPFRPTVNSTHAAGTGQRMRLHQTNQTIN